MTWEWVVLILGVTWAIPMAQWVAMKMEDNRQYHLRMMEEFKARNGS